MNRLKLIVLLICVVVFANTVEAQILRKGGSYLLKKLGREAAEESAEKAGKKAVVESTKTATRQLAISTGRKTAQASGQLIPSAAKNLAKHYGDDAVKLLARASARDARRMAMFVDDIPAGQRNKLMTFISGHKNPSRVIDFLYKHRAELVTGGLVVALLANPEEVLGAASDGVAKIVNATGESMIAPIAEKAAKPLGHWLGFTCFAAGMVAICGWLARLQWNSVKTEHPSV